MQQVRDRAKIVHVIDNLTFFVFPFLPTTWEIDIMALMIGPRTLGLSMGRVQTRTRPEPDPIKRVWKGLLWTHTRLPVYLSIKWDGSDFI